jgi:hypothetical protein
MAQCCNKTASTSLQCSATAYWRPTTREHRSPTALECDINFSWQHHESVADLKSAETSFAPGLQTCYKQISELRQLIILSSVLQISRCANQSTGGSRFTHLVVFLKKVSAYQIGVNEKCEGMGGERHTLPPGKVAGCAPRTKIIYH